MSYSYEANLYYRGFNAGVARKPSKRKSGATRSFVGVHSGYNGSRVRRSSSFGSRMASGRKHSSVLSAGKAFSGAGKVAVGSAIGVGAVFVNAWKAASNIKSGRTKVVIQPSMVIIGLIMVAVSLSLIQLAHFNLVATKGYELRRLEADRQQLLSSYEVKNMKLAQVKSLSEIAGSDRASAMVRPASVSFMRGNTALAKLP